MNNWKMFLGSFQNMKKKLFWLVLGLEYAFYMLSFVAFIIYTRLTEGLGSLLPSELNFYAADAVLEANAASLESFFIKVIWFTLLLLIFMLLNFSLWRGLVWSKILDKKFRFKKFCKFNLLNLVWLIILGVLIAIFVLIFAPLISSATTYLEPFGFIISFIVILPIYIFLLVPIFIYIVNITNVLHLKFFETKHFIKETFDVIKKVDKLYIPYVWMGAIFTILVFLYNVPFFNQGNYYGIALMFVLVALFCTWVKLYLVDLLKHLH